MIDDKRQIAAVTLNFLPMQLIYTGKAKVCLPNVEFSRGFHVMYTENHWSNQLKASTHFEDLIFPYLGQIKENMAFPKEEMSLVIMDTFKYRTTMIWENFVPNITVRLR